MVTPEIRYFHSPDVDDLDSYFPSEADNFAFLLEMAIGPSGAPGEEVFGIEVSTPESLRERYGSDGLVSGENRLVVFSYDWPRIEAFLRKKVSSCAGRDWQEVARKIARFSRWEFDAVEPPRSQS